MGRTEDSEEMRELKLLEVIEEEPEVRQVDLAAQLGVAVGTVNWLIKRLAAKGYVKVKRIGQWRWRYILTPRGFAEKARLTQQYLKYSMSLYRETRQKARCLLSKMRKEGYSHVLLEGDPENDLVDVCRLTCLELGIEIVNSVRSSSGKEPPKLQVIGRDLKLELPKAEEEDG